MRTLVHKALPAYAITLFALFFLTMLLYLLHIDNWDHEVTPHYRRNDILSVSGNHGNPAAAGVLPVFPS